MEIHNITKELNTISMGGVAVNGTLSMAQEIILMATIVLATHPEFNRPR